MRCPFAAGDLLVIVRARPGFEDRFPVGFTWHWNGHGMNDFEYWNLLECRRATPEEETIYRLRGNK